MAEEKMQAAKVLLKNPYRQVILQDYNKTLESHKFRKKAEEIENELSWFTGKSSVKLIISKLLDQEVYRIVSRIVINFFS